MLLDERLRKTKCATCVHVDVGNPASIEPFSPCSYCADRPTRKKDVSQYLKCPVEILLDIHDSANADSKYNY